MPVTAGGEASSRSALIMVVEPVVASIVGQVQEVLSLAQPVTVGTRSTLLSLWERTHHRLWWIYHQRLRNSTT